MARKYILPLTLTDRRLIEPDMALLRFSRSGEQALPPFEAGQFVELHVPHCNALLNRPFSVFKADADTMDLIVKAVGKVSSELLEMPLSTPVKAIGPLGNSFSITAERPLLVGGGAGMAPMIALCRAYAAKGIRPAVIVGNRSAIEPFFTEALEGIATVTICTDDGSQGFHGLVTACPEFKPELYSIVQACGPTPMMKAVAAVAAQKGVECEVSLENKMACGLGACLCCVQDTTDGQRKCVCTEGPVFNSKELLW